MKPEFSRHIFEMCSDIKFHKNPLRGSRVPCGRTDVTMLVVAFRNFVNAHKNLRELLLYYKVRSIALLRLCRGFAVLASACDWLSVHWSLVTGHWSSPYCVFIIIICFNGWDRTWHFLSTTIPRLTLRLRSGVSDMSVHRRGCSWSSDTNTMEPDRPQHDCLAACVIAQQYSSACFVLLLFHCRKDEAGAFLR